MKKRVISAVVLLAVTFVCVLLSTVSRVPSVYDARRIMPGEGGNEMKRRTN